MAHLISSLIPHRNLTNREAMPQHQQIFGNVNLTMGFIISICIIALVIGLATHMAAQLITFIGDQVTQQAQPPVSHEPITVGNAVDLLH
ncbi:MAG: hypothetical protein H3C36_13720 [Chitinophagaceae bacterium]|nr:hypothetical protein [Chitinophagaceae bacterium]MCW5914728.1 hypothetical protein [Chitinophagaceae bacterium]MCZ2397220.1 hypothetical protein [Chitinophagales bacterium]